MDNLKPFDPHDIDASLLRLISYGGKRYALFPFLDVTGALPEFRSVRQPIQGAQITVAELAALADSIQRLGSKALWFIQFSTPWLVRPDDMATSRPAVDKRAPR